MSNYLMKLVFAQQYKMRQLTNFNNSIKPNYFYMLFQT